MVLLIFNVSIEVFLIFLHSNEKDLLPIRLPEISSDSIILTFFRYFDILANSISFKSF